MRRFILLFIFIFTNFYFCLGQDFNAKDRVLILAPHPDDEAVALSGIIQNALAKRAKLKIVYLTNGDYNEFSYLIYKKRPAFSKEGFIQIGKSRQQEAIKAMEFLGINKDNLIFLGYPDRFTESILTGFWDKDKPPASFLTHISRVPYEDAPSYSAPYVGQSILADLKNILIDFKPTKIFVSSPEDTNPDHRSSYVYINVALLDLADTLKPEVYIYFVHKAGWPKPRQYKPEESLEPPVDTSGQIKWEKFYLSQSEEQNKYRAISFYKSQLALVEPYFLSFVRKNELFYFQPQIDLAKGKTLRSFTVASNLLSRISYSRDDNFLYIHIAFNKKVAEGIKADVYLLGYKKDKDFSLMPKIFFKVKGKYFIAYDKRKRVYIDGVVQNVNDNNMFIKFPLKSLDMPDYIFSRIILKGKIFALYINPWLILKMQ